MSRVERKEIEEWRQAQRRLYHAKFASELYRHCERIYPELITVEELMGLRMAYEMEHKGRRLDLHYIAFETGAIAGKLEQGHYIIGLLGRDCLDTSSIPELEIPQHIITLVRSLETPEEGSS